MAAPAMIQNLTDLWTSCPPSGPRLVSGAKLAPQGRLRTAQGASPGNKHSNKGSPEGAMQLVPVPKRRLMTSIYLELRSNSLRRPFRAFRNLDLEPRACALGCPAGPFGVLGFAPETSQRQDVPLHHGDTEGTKISQRHRGSSCTSVCSVSPW